MPLRDHFRPPPDETASWEGFHGQWPAVLVQHLCKLLPPRYVAEPRVQFGSQVEIDVAAFETGAPAPAAMKQDQGGVATAVGAPSVPSVAVATTLPEYAEYAVRVFDARRGRSLVAAVEIVSPANEDRPEHRNLFVAMCAAMVQKGVAVSIVDFVTVRTFNLYAALMTFIGHADPTFADSPGPLYAASCRWIRKGEQPVLEAWSHELAIGQTLPTLPLWLSRDLVVPLDLESSYEQACRDLRIA